MIEGPDVHDDDRQCVLKTDAVGNSIGCQRLRQPRCAPACTCAHDHGHGCWDEDTPIPRSQSCAGQGHISVLLLNQLPMCKSGHCAAKLLPPADLSRTAHRAPLKTDRAVMSLLSTLVMAQRLM